MKFSNKALLSAGIAGKVAAVLGDTEIDAKPFLLGILCANGNCSLILQKLGASARDLRVQLVPNAKAHRWDVPGKRIAQTKNAKKVVVSAIDFGKELGSSTVGTGHFLLAIVSMECAEKEMLAHENVTRERVLNELKEMAAEEPPPPRSQ